jgi:hypothetical protein
MKPSTDTPLGTSIRSGEPPGLVELAIGATTPRPIQGLALERGLLTSRRNLIIAAPTNSGKSAVGLIGLLQAIKTQRRAILSGLSALPSAHRRLPCLIVPPGIIWEQGSGAPSAISDTTKSTPFQNLRYGHR